MNSNDVLSRAAAIRDWIVDVRRELHRHPELMYEEVRTSACVARELTALGIDYVGNVAKTGIVAFIGRREGPCVGLRADMDALPIHEETEVEFRSTTDNRMHACGHDCHTAMLLGAARLLKAVESDLPGGVKLLFQPAEEGGAGGLRMCEEGVLSDPAVERMFGLHVWPFLPVGTIGSRAGTLLAATSMFEATIAGKGGHAAMPHLAIDPIVAAAGVISQLQAIVSREIDPLAAAIVSVTTIHAGEALNVIPPTARCGGTLRSLTSGGLGQLKQRLVEVIRSAAEAHRCEADVTFVGPDYPATVNDAAIWKVAGAVGRDLLGAEAVREIDPVMGGEDFAYYCERVPSCFVALGVRNEAIGASYSVHHPRFMVDEDALPIGTALHTAFALRSLTELAARSARVEEVGSSGG
ncbi:MAG: amidohydrolase [Vicinamibacterales bacterium]